MNTIKGTPPHAQANAASTGVAGVCNCAQQRREIFLFFTHHGEHAGRVVLECEVLIGELWPINGLAARAISCRKVSALL